MSVHDNYQAKRKYPEKQPQQQTQHGNNSNIQLDHPEC